MKVNILKPSHHASVEGKIVALSSGLNELPKDLCEQLIKAGVAEAFEEPKKAKSKKKEEDS